VEVRGEDDSGPRQTREQKNSDTLNRLW
jgi:hypothetical protein